MRSAYALLHRCTLTAEQRTTLAAAGVNTAWDDVDGDGVPDALTREQYSVIERDLNTLEEQAVTALAKGVSKFADRNLSTLDREWRGGPESLKWLQRYELHGQPHITTPIKDALRMTYELGRQHVREEEPRLATNARRAPRPSMSDKAAIDYLETKAHAASRKLVDRIAAQTHQILLDAVKTGEHRPTTFNKLADMYASYGGRAAAYPTTVGVPPSRAQINTIIRTTMTDAYNHGRITRAVESGNVKGFQYSAVLDNRTTDVCAMLNGHTIPIDNQRLEEFSPPNHFNCRSILIPVRGVLLRRVTDDLLNNVAALKPKGWN